MQVALLIKSTLIALNHANSTGNYTVLRDLGTSSFQQSFSAAGLTDSFKKLRDRRLNLTPVLLKRPVLTRDVTINENGTMVLEGYMPTDPLSIRFKIYFQRVQKDWRLAGLAVDTIPLKKLRTAKVSRKNAKPSASDVTATVPRERSQGKRATAEKQAKRPAEEKAVTKASPPPARKPEIKRDAAAAEKEGQATSKVENRTSTDAVRIDLSATEQPEANTPSESGSSLWRSLNPFAGD